MIPVFLTRNWTKWGRWSQAENNPQPDAEREQVSSRWARCLTPQNTHRRRHRLLLGALPSCSSPAKDGRHTKAEENFQLSVVQTATVSSDSPAAHVLLLLGLVRQTVLGPSAPQGLTQVFPVLLSPSPGKLESNRTHSGVDIHTTGLSEQKEYL